MRPSGYAPSRKRSAAAGPQIADFTAPANEDAGIRAPPPPRRRRKTCPPPWPHTPQDLLTDEAEALLALRDANPGSELPELWRGAPSAAWPGLTADPETGAIAEL